VLEALRRGERSPLTAMYFLLRQRELRRGAIEAPTYKLLPKPPPPRQPAQRRRPVLANLRAAAARLPAEPLPEITHKLQLTGLGVQKPPRAAAAAAAAVPPIVGIHGTAGRPPAAADAPRQHSHRDDTKHTAVAGAAARGGARDDQLYVHASGALTDRPDRDGATRRGRELERGGGGGGGGGGAGEPPPAPVVSRREPSSERSRISGSMPWNKSPRKAAAKDERSRDGHVRTNELRALPGGGGGTPEREKTKPLLSFGVRGSRVPGLSPKKSPR